ncbi:hypothetical protein QFC21_004506 [Naganishia friedmannii]|uniref:Uncharacterized protein n=1 Tax=Naganishia friedmannii TaxID=89922 RepID=A0ACC2VHZ5_9TREE|nr:hypothetical protein QFC21_004506 [Naganishia friedmannii]
MEDPDGTAEPLPPSIPDTGSIDRIDQITEVDPPATTEDQPPLRHLSVLKRQRSDSYDYEAIYRSLPASPTAVTEVSQGETHNPPEDSIISALLPSTADTDGSLVTPSTASMERNQRAHSQPFGFSDDTENDGTHPTKKRRLFQHEHQLDTTNGVDETPSTMDEHMAATAHADGAEDHDSITAQLMASLQQAVEDPEYATTTLAEAEAEADQAQQHSAAASPIKDAGEGSLSERHEDQPEPDTFPHDDILNAFISASTEASPKLPSIPEPQTAAESPKHDVTDNKVALPAAASPAATSMSPGQQKSPAASEAIDSALNTLAPRLGASPRPVQVVPSPRPVTLPMNPRPVATTVLPMANGSSRPLLGAPSSRTPTLSNSRPVMVTAFTSSGPQLVRPIPKKTLPRDFTPSRPMDKRRQIPRKVSGRGSSSTPPMPNPYDLAAKNSIVVKPVVEEPDITSSLSVETLAVLEAAATSLSQIQGPVTQEHLEAIVLQLTNAGIDLSQLGLGNLVAQDEDDDTTNQLHHRADNHMDMSGNSIFGDGGSQSFHDMPDSQPDDMNLQAQSLIAALSALVPQSQPTAETRRPINMVVDAPASITIDLTDEPDEEPAVASKTVPDAETTSITAKSPIGDKSTSPEPDASANTESQATELSDELIQEKTRLMNLDIPARIETLEGMIRELEQDLATKPLIVPASEDVTEAGDKLESQVILDDEQRNSENVPEVDKDRPITGGEASPKLCPPSAETMNVDAKKAEHRSNRLALYARLLNSAKTESTASKVDALVIKDTDKLTITPASLDKSSHLPDEATSMLPTSSSPAASSKPSDTSIVDAQADIPVPADKDRESTAHAENQPSTDTISPPTETVHQETLRDQAPEVPAQEPVFVKSEPVDFDFSTATSTSIPPVSTVVTTEATAGAEADHHGADNSAYTNEDDHGVQPAETSMEEDPLLAELFPTFPMGGSPAQAHHMQAEEESDPMLAGMLQELDASNGHNDMNYDNSHGNDFTGAWNPWAEVPHVIPETIVQVSSAFDMDPDPHKINLGLIGFREDSGRIFVPPTTRQAGIRMAYGSDSKPYREARIAAIQATSVTGALRLGGTFLARFPLHLGMKSVFVPNPTTGEDARALHEAGLDVKLYRFFDRAHGGVDFAGMCEDLARAPEQSIVLLHVSGSSPTGASLIIPQWRTLIDILKAGRHIPFLIMEFQGLASGDPNIDAHPVRYMAQEGIPFMLAQSFDSAMGLYIDSPSILSIVAHSHQEKLRIESQMRHVARTLHSHPGPLGAHIAAGILNDSQMYRSWLKEIKAMSDRLRSIREKLYDYLTNKLQTPGVWTHFRGSRGMYSAVLLDPMQIRTLATREHIHMLPDGCFSLGCLNAAKIEILARAIDRVVRDPEPYLTDDTTLQLELALHEPFPSFE